MLCIPPVTTGNHVDINNKIAHTAICLATDNKFKCGTVPQDLQSMPAPLNTF